MESLAYIHCACAYAESTEIESVPSTDSALVPKQMQRKNFSKLAWLYLLPIALVVSVFCVPDQAQAYYLRQGSRGYKVVKVQNRLRSRGYFPKYVPSTGYFGPVTRIGVRYFQRHSRLRVDGVVGPRTARALGVRYRHGHYHARRWHRHHHAYYYNRNRRTLGFRDRGMDVAKLQRKLWYRGYFYMRPTGYFGPRTANAVIRFQRDYGLYQDGVVGGRTRARLYRWG